MCCDLLELTLALACWQRPATCYIVQYYGTSLCILVLCYTDTLAALCKYTADDEGPGDDVAPVAVGSKRPGEKLEQQKEQNRVQARIARQKKKQHVEELKAKVGQLAQEKVQHFAAILDAQSY